MWESELKKWNICKALKLFTLYRAIDQRNSSNHQLFGRVGTVKEDRRSSEDLDDN
jgi:hypothetical protein